MENKDFNRRDGENNGERKARRPRIQHKKVADGNGYRNHNDDGNSYQSDNPRRNSNDDNNRRSFNDGNRRNYNNNDNRRNYGNREDSQHNNHRSNKESHRNYNRDDNRPRYSQSDRDNNRQRYSQSDRDPNRFEYPFSDNNGRRTLNRDNGNRRGGNNQKKRSSNKVQSDAARYLKNGYSRATTEGQDRPPIDALPGKSTYASRGMVRLNKYIANAGICSRREADNLIQAGSVMVNGEVVTQMGYLVKEGDVVNYGGETLRSEAKRYFLLNKPKGFITTSDDPKDRKTVMDIIGNACHERIYPVGRLDRNTTGLLLFTNDGEMSRKLTHPSTGVYKVYQVELDKPVTFEDMQRMITGIELEDGIISVDDVAYANDGSDRRIVGVQLHSGKNRIVRRIFENMGYNVHKLDRTVFAGLTKKDLPRGRFRELTSTEVNYLKMI